MGYWMGTDENGRDVMSRIILRRAGASMSAGVIRVSIAAGIGVPVGLVAGFAAVAVDISDRPRGGRDAGLPGPDPGYRAWPPFLGPSLQNAMIAIGITASARLRAHFPRCHAGRRNQRTTSKRPAPSAIRPGAVASATSCRTSSLR